MKKIAFLFLIYDKINLETLWYNFFHHVDKKKYTIYVHCKDNATLQYFEQYKLTNCIETKYSHISVVHAQNLLLEEALKDENNEHFVFLSGACVPFKKFEHVYDNLNIFKSYFNIAPHEQCFPRCNDLLPHISRDNIQKASQWCILNRKHSEIVIQEKYTKYIDFYLTVPASNEHYIITTLFMENLKNELVLTMNSANDATTFTNWPDMKYKYRSKKGIKNYSSISEEELQYLLKSKCFFGRKFNPECAPCFSNVFYDNLII